MFSPRPLPLRTLCATVLFSCCGASSVRLYRSPSGLAALPWATAHAKHFRTLDILGFPPSGLWNEQQYVREITRDAATVFGIWNDEDDALVAFACSEQVLDETHMLSLTVHPSWRGCGLARTLVLATLWEARAAGQTLVTLEVRESNEAAIRLYESCGLHLIGRRRRYYREPSEDALLLARHFVDGNDGGGDATDGASDASLLDGDGSLDALISAAPAGMAIRRAAVGDVGGSDTEMMHGELLGQVPILAVGGGVM